MKSHHTKNKGDLGVFKAQVNLCEKGFLILSPQTEHAPFDLVAYKDHKFLRVQVKYRSAKKGKIQVALANSWADKLGSHRTELDKSQIDLFCIYCPETDECYYFDPKRAGKSVTIRIAPTSNGQQKTVNFCDEFRQIPDHLV